MRKPVIAGNWKMYKTIAEAVDFIEKIKPVAAKAEHCEVVVAPPFTALAAAAQAAKGSKVAVSAQDVHWDKEGAHTGDISPGMLVDAGCTHVIIGHSERRHDHGETDEQVNRKTEGGPGRGPDPDRLRRRNPGGARIRPHGRSFESPIRGRISRIDPLRLFPYHNCLRAGLGDWHGSHRDAGNGGGNPSPACASLARQKFGEKEASAVRILYGGSVKPDNVGGLMAAGRN